MVNKWVCHPWCQIGDFHEVDIIIVIKHFTHSFFWSWSDPTTITVWMASQVKIEVVVTLADTQNTWMCRWVTNVPIPIQAPNIGIRV